MFYGQAVASPDSGVLVAACQLNQEAAYPQRARRTIVGLEGPKSFWKAVKGTDDDKGNATWRRQAKQRNDGSAKLVTKSMSRKRCQCLSTLLLIASCALPVRPCAHALAYIQCSLPTLSIILQVEG